MKHYLEKEKWDTFICTYSSGDVSDIWKSVFIMCDMFDSIAKEVAYNMKFEYKEIEARNSLQYLKDVKILPKNAKKMY